MATCPRCGALVKPGRSACWNCWASLPPEQPAAVVASPSPAEPAPMPEAQAEAAPAVATVEAPPAEEIPPEPAPLVIEVSTPQEEPISIPEEPLAFKEVTVLPPEPEPVSEPIVEPVPEPVIESIQEPFAEAASEPVVEPGDMPTHPPKPEPQILLPAQPRQQRSVLPNAWLIGLTTLLVLIVAALALVWRFSFIPSVPQTDEPDTAAQHYLTALLLGNTPEQQQLSTEASRGEHFPAWISFDRGRLLDKAKIQGERAEMSLEITLIPGELPQGAPFALTDALSHPYTVTLVLQREAGRWHVDQQQLAHNLQETLLAENPEVLFPEWK